MLLSARLHWLLCSTEFVPGEPDIQALTPVPLYEQASQRQETIDFLTSAGFELVESKPQTQGQEENLAFVRKT